MILTALNKVEIDLGFDCDGDDQPDTIDIFQKSSETSCCRLADLPSSSDRYQDPSPSTPVKPVVKHSPGIFGKLFSSNPSKK